MYRAKLYPLIEILFVILCGSICGAESWRDFVLFGKEKIDRLREYYPFENGIASKDTFARVFSVLNPEEFKSCFVAWVKSLQTALNEIIAIDGKTLCGSANLQNGTPANSVNALSLRFKLFFNCFISSCIRRLAALFFFCGVRQFICSTSGSTKTLKICCFHALQI